MFKQLSECYHQLLMNTENGNQLLKWRNLSPNVTDAFQLGFSPFDDSKIVQKLEKHKSTLLENKLFYESNGELHDNMRGRLVFPIQNEKGDVVAFGGRDVTGKDNVKYLNTGDNDYFKKSHILYGLPQAKKSIERRNYVVLMEGYMDVIQSHQNNIKNVVSALGTNLSEEQATLIRKYTPNVVIAFDNDGAGSNATIQTANLLQKHGCNVLIAYMGSKYEGYDPDDYIKELGGVSFQKNIIAKAYPVIDFFMKNPAKKYNFSYDNNRYNYTEEILKLIRSINDNQQYTQSIRFIVKNFNISKEMLKNIKYNHKKRVFEMQVDTLQTEKLNVSEDVFDMDVFSYSRLKKFEDCPFQFFKKYILGKEEPKTFPLALG